MTLKTIFTLFALTVRKGVLSYSILNDFSILMKCTRHKCVELRIWLEKKAWFVVENYGKLFVNFPSMYLEMKTFSIFSRFPSNRSLAALKKWLSRLYVNQQILVRFYNKCLLLPSLRFSRIVWKPASLLSFGELFSKLLAPFPSPIPFK